MADNSTFYKDLIIGALTITQANGNLLTTGALGAGAITGTSFIIGANTLNTTEWAFLDGQDQSVFTTSTPTFANLKITAGGDIRPSANSTTAINIAQADGTDFVTFDTTNKRVGIGTTSPAYRLIITQSPTVVDGNYRVTMSQLYPNFATTDSGTNIALMGYFYSSGAGNYTGFNYGLAGSAYHNGSGLMSNMYGLFFAGGIEGTGNVTDFRCISVETYGTGSGTIGTATGLNIASLSRYNSPTTMYGVNVNANTAAVGTSKYGVYIGSQSGATTNNFALYSAGGTNYFNGNVGIGATSPGYLLDIVGGATGATTNLLQIRSNFTTNNTASTLRFANSTDDTAANGSGLITVIRTNTSASGDSDMTFSTTAGATISEKIRINSLGNVGIGTTTPATLLEISKLTAPTLRLSNLKDGVFTQNEIMNTIDFYSGDTSTAPKVIASIANLTDYPAAHNTARGMLQFNVSGTGAIFEAMRISSGGNVGIGTTTPTAVLHIKAGTATASTAPLKFTSGTLLTAPEAGAVEFLTDDYYATQTTSTIRKKFLFNIGKITTVTTTYTVLADDETVIGNSTTAFTITMPTTVVGQIFEISNINTGSVTVDGASSDTIDGQANVVLSQWDSVKLQCYAANAWKIK